MSTSTSDGPAKFPSYLLGEQQSPTVENVDLYIAVKNGRPQSEIVKLLQLGGNPNYFHQRDENRNALHVACEKGDLSLVQLLVDNGADVDAKVLPSHNIPLHIAVIAQSEEIVAYLIEKGSSVNAANGYGNTPLHEAARLSHPGLLRFLMSKGADINAANHRGSTPLHHLCYGPSHSSSSSSSSSSSMNQLECLRRLLDAGALVDAKDRDGVTPLHVCAQNGFIDGAQRLLHAGADARAKDNTGRSAMDIAGFHRQSAFTKWFDDAVEREGPESAEGAGVSSRSESKMSS